MKPTKLCQRVERYIRGVRRVGGLAAISAKLSGAMEIDRSDRLAAVA